MQSNLHVFLLLSVQNYSSPYLPLPQASDKQSCKILVNDFIDRDTLDTEKYKDYRITILVEATPKNNPKISATFKVVYVLEDSNDETPVFVTDTLTAELNENSDPDESEWTRRMYMERKLRHYVSLCITKDLV